MSHEYAPFLRCLSIAEMNRGLLNPGAAMRGDQRRDKCSPGHDMCFASKPRHFDERFHVHASNVGSLACKSKRQRFFLFFQIFDFPIRLADS